MAGTRQDAAEALLRFTAGNPLPFALALMQAASEVRATVIRARRSATGLTIEEAARRADLSVSTWNNLENPVHPGLRLRTIRQALAALDVPEQTIVADPTEDGLLQAMAALPFGEPSSPDEQDEISALVGKLRRLTEAERRVVEELVDSLLRHRVLESSG